MKKSMKSTIAKQLIEGIKKGIISSTAMAW